MRCINWATNSHFFPKVGILWRENAEQSWRLKPFLYFRQPGGMTKTWFLNINNYSEYVQSFDKINNIIIFWIDSFCVPPNYTISLARKFFVYEPSQSTQQTKNFKNTIYKGKNRKSGSKKPPTHPNFPSKAAFFPILDKTIHGLNPLQMDANLFVPATTKIVWKGTTDQKVFDYKKLSKQLIGG